MSEQPPLVRQWILLRMLSGRHYGAAVKEMAAETGVSQKTIRRDLETFQEAGFPLEETVGPRGRKTWRMRPIPGETPMSFTFDEAVALCLGRHLLEPLAGTVFWEAAQRAFRKIKASFGPEALKCVDRFAGLFRQTTVGTSDYSKKTDLLDTLTVGMEDRRAVFITYQSLRATEPVTYDAYPYGFVYHRGSLYLVGRAPQHDAIRHWKVDRIEAAELTPVHFQRPEGFDLQEHLAKSFGVFHGTGEHHVRVRFSPSVARYVEEKNWHPSQKLTRQPDNTLIAEFDLSHTEEVKRWILSFGKEAVALAPERLRKEVKDELHSALLQYRREPQPSRGIPRQNPARGPKP